MTLSISKKKMEIQNQTFYGDMVNMGYGGNIIGLYDQQYAMWSSLKIGDLFQSTNRGIFQLEN